MKKLTPNYTKSTTSTDARRRGKNLKMDRATCSYSRCSLNGHVDALLPPLKSFVSARRQTLKTERSMKPICESPKARPTKGSQDCGKLIGRDEAGTSDGDMWRDIDPISWAQEGAETEILRRPCIGSCDVEREKDERLGNFFDEMSVDEEVSQEFFDEESLNSGNQAPHPLEMPDKSSIQVAGKYDKSNLQEADEPTCFNPHFLPLEADPEAEKVRLRHQEVTARKNGEEWMVDYALREAIGPTHQRKVASLVEAFERLLPTTKT